MYLKQSVLGFVGPTQVPTESAVFSSMAYFGFLVRLGTANPKPKLETAKSRSCLVARLALVCQVVLKGRVRRVYGFVGLRVIGLRF